MTSLRTQVPPVNLKERIAALQQQKNANQTQRPTSPPLTTPNSAGSGSSSAASSGQSNVAALREKIAKFEKKGGVPVPRGSFGLGGPPPPDGGQSKTSRELYGNRIPAPVKPQNTGNATIKPQLTGGTLLQHQLTGPANLGTPSPAPSFSPPSPNLEPLKPTYTGRRATEFSKAMQLARKAESENQQVYDPRLTMRESSPESTPPPPIIANRRFSAFLDDPPTIVVSPQLDSAVESEISSDPAMFHTFEQDEESTPVNVMQDSAPVSLIGSEDLPTSVSVPQEAETSKDDIDQAVELASVSHKSVEEISSRTPAPVSPPSHDASTLSESLVSSPSVAQEPPTGISSVLNSDVDALDRTQEAEMPNSSATPETVVQVGLLYDDVSKNNDSLVYNSISTPTTSRDEFLTPVPSPAAAASMITTSEISVTAPPPSKADASADIAGSLAVDTESLAPSSIPPTPDSERKYNYNRDSFLSSYSSNSYSQSIEVAPSVSSSRPSSFMMGMESPGKLTLAHRVSPATSRGVPVFIRGTRTEASPNGIDVADVGYETTDMATASDVAFPSSPVQVEQDNTVTKIASDHQPEIEPESPPPISSKSQTQPDTPSGPAKAPKTPHTSVPSAWSDTVSPEGVEFGEVVIKDKEGGGSSSSAKPSNTYRDVPLMIHPRSHSSSYPNMEGRADTEVEVEADFNPPFDRHNNNNGKKSGSYSAVIHGKATRESTETYSAHTLPRAAAKATTVVVAATPQRGRGSHRPPALVEPVSPGYGDLALLVEQSAMLEKRLMDGELFDEAEMNRRKAIEKGAMSAPARAGGGGRGEVGAEEQDEQNRQLMRKRSTKSVKSLKAGRGSTDSSSGARRMPSFSLRNTLTLGRSKSANRIEKEEEEAFVVLGRPSTEGRRVGEPMNQNRSKSMYLTSSSQPSLSTFAVPPVPAVPPTVAASTIATPAADTATTPADEVPPTPPPKSPGAKYLSSFRRFASTGSTRTSGAYQRYSISMSSSEISSEDSVAVLTPPDNSPGFAGVLPGAVSDSGASLLETRTWSRARAPSGNGNRAGSMINMPWSSSSSATSSPSTSPKKAMSRATSFAEKMFRGRKKSSGSVISTIEVAEPLQVPEIPSVLPSSPSLHELILSDTSFDSLQPPPSTPHRENPTDRPSSWISNVSNASYDSSVRSMLFDKDVFDAFPSVPQTVPTPNTRGTIVSQTQGGSITFPLASDWKQYRDGKPMLGRAESTKSTSTLGPADRSVGDLL